MSADGVPPVTSAQPAAPITPVPQAAPAVFTLPISEEQAQNPQTQTASAPNQANPANQSPQQRPVGQANPRNHSAQQASQSNQPRQARTPPQTTQTNSSEQATQSTPQSRASQAPYAPTQSTQPQDVQARNTVQSRTQVNAQEQNADNQKAQTARIDQTLAQSPTTSSMPPRHRPDLSPLVNDLRENFAEKTGENLDYADIKPTVPTNAIQNNSPDNPSLDSRVLEHDLLDHPAPGEQPQETQAPGGLVSELLAMRESLQQDIDRIDRLLKGIL